MFVLFYTFKMYMNYGLNYVCIILILCRHERKEADLLKTLNDAEIEKEEETSTLFRAASLTTTPVSYTHLDVYKRQVERSSFYGNISFRK